MKFVGGGAGTADKKIPSRVTYTWEGKGEKKRKC